MAVMIRTAAAAVAAALLIPAGARAADRVYPEGVAVTVTRECDSLLIIPGTPLDVRVYVVNGTPSALRGVIYAEHVPAVYGVETIGVSIDGVPVPGYLYEVSPHDIYPETDVHRWVLEEPGRYDEQAHPLPAGGELVVTYRMSGTWFYPTEMPPYCATWEREIPAGEYGFAWCDEGQFINADTDGDGMADSYEIYYFSGLSHDGTTDSDGDGLNDILEYREGANPLNPDTDVDGLNDGAEVSVHGTSPILADTDGDGLNDGGEVNTWGTNPLSTDTDGDLLPDYEEVVTSGTDPVDADTDNDGLDDYAEVMYDGAAGYAPYDPVSGPSGTDLDARDPDSDHDGYSDYLETRLQSNPLNGARKPAAVTVNFQPRAARIPAGFCPVGPEVYTPRGFGWQ